VRTASLAAAARASHRQVSYRRRSRSAPRRLRLLRPLRPRLRDAGRTALSRRGPMEGSYRRPAGRGSAAEGGRSSDRWGDWEPAVAL